LSHTVRMFVFSLAAAFVLGACNQGGGPAASATGTVGSGAASGSPAARATPGQTSGRPTGIPETFPLPPSYDVQAATAREGTVVVALGVPSAEDAYTFYKDALPKAGYRIERDNEVGQLKSLGISGHGMAGDVGIGSMLGKPTVMITLSTSSS
jgi:hypothetical protein